MNDEARRPPAVQASWIAILCLIGLDYFSTLGYQPSLAFQGAGVLAPVATVAVVLITLLGALPVYWYVAGRSPRGQGSIGLLEKLAPGWIGKTLVLILLAFAATDFVFTRTFSAADAAVHLVRNPSPRWQKFLDFLFQAGDAARPISTHPLWQKVMGLWNRQMVVTVLLLIVGFLFWSAFRRGFTRRVIHLAVAVTVLYMALSALAIASGLIYLARNPAILEAWWDAAAQAAKLGELTPSFRAPALALIGLVLLPKVALGLSGFEMSMVVMPLIKGASNDDPASPSGRIRNTRKMLVAAAFVMAVYLVGSSLVTAALIPAEAFAADGAAANRALAYLSHGGRMTDGHLASDLAPFFGQAFGTVYDFSTVLILCLAGASVTIGLRDLVPPYLHRLGMELPWAQAVGGILAVFNLIKLSVTVGFQADVGAQRGAYATCVLLLMASAALASFLDRWMDRPRGRGGRLSWPFLLITLVFASTASSVIVANPNGVVIALGLILVILIVSMLSRALRATELRWLGFQFTDDQSRFLWDSMKFSEFPILVPHRPRGRDLAHKEKDIRERHRLGEKVPLVFIEAVLGDPSEFFHRPMLEVRKENERFTVRVSRCPSIPHALAAVALELSAVGAPPELHFGWSDERPLAANLSFVLFGQGNIPWMVRELIRKAEPNPERRPRIIVG